VNVWFYLSFQPSIFVKKIGLKKIGHDAPHELFNKNKGDPCLQCPNVVNGKSFMSSNLATT
jgi:hypothetical protein